LASAFGVRAKQHKLLSGVPLAQKKLSPLFRGVNTVGYSTLLIRTIISRNLTTLMSLTILSL